ncbi:MAG: ATP-binding protein [Flavobacteriales bacterium]
MQNIESYSDFLENLNKERRYRFTKSVIWFGFIADLVFFIHDRLFDSQRIIIPLDILMVVGYLALVVFIKHTRDKEWIAPLLLITSYFWIFFNCLIYGKDSELELFFITIPAASIFVVDHKKTLTIITLLGLPIIALIVLYSGAYAWQPIQNLQPDFLNRTAIIAIIMNMALVLLFINRLIKNTTSTTAQLTEKHAELLNKNNELEFINHRQRVDNDFLDKRVDEVVHELRQKEREVTLKLIQNEENQKQRIAKELHDSVGVLLSTAKLNLENNSDDKELQFALQLVDKACKEVRSISHEMTPTLFKELGLVKSLYDFQEMFSQGGKMELEIVVKDYNGELGVDNELVVYRMIKETINNAIKHASCSVITIQIFLRDRKLIVSVEDDGKGFDIYASKTGLGISSIKQRVELLGGIHTIESALNKGTIHIIEIPL